MIQVFNPFTTPDEIALPDVTYEPKTVPCPNLEVHLVAKETNQSFECEHCTGEMFNYNALEDSQLAERTAAQYEILDEKKNYKALGRLNRLPLLTFNVSRNRCAVCGLYLGERKGLPFPPEVYEALKCDDMIGYKVRGRYMIQQPLCPVHAFLEKERLAVADRMRERRHRWMMTAWFFAPYRWLRKLKGYVTYQVTRQQPIEFEKKWKDSIEGMARDGAKVIHHAGDHDCSSCGRQARFTFIVIDNEALAAQTVIEKKDGE